MSAPKRKASGANIDDWQRNTRKLTLRLPPLVADILQDQHESQSVAIATLVSLAILDIYGGQYADGPSLRAAIARKLASAEHASEGDMNNVIALRFPCAYTAGCRGAFIINVGPDGDHPDRQAYRDALEKQVGGSAACSTCGERAGITGAETLAALEVELDKHPAFKLS